MRSTTNHLPVILLLGRRNSNDEIDTWLEKSRYSTSEATDVFQAIEQISDFTVESAPDVVFLHVERLQAERETLEKMLSTSAGAFCASVVTFSDHGTRFDSGFGVLAKQLDQLIPGGSQLT